MFLLPVPSVVLFLVLHANAVSSDSLPNGWCRYDNRFLRCDNGVDFTGTSTISYFNVTIIPTDVLKIHLLSCAQWRGPYCNVLGDDVTPFPSSLVTLQSAKFQGFQNRDGKVIEFRVFNGLLDNVKRQLTELEITESKVGKLESRCFSGYKRLRWLRLTNNGIQEISSESFLQMVDIGTAPALTELRLENNAITFFDWGTLGPIAGRLEHFDLHHQRPRLQTIVQTSPPFTMPRLRVVQLADNQLRTIPKEVLDTISGPLRDHRGLIVMLEDNFLCPENADCDCCGCCALKDLADWASRRSQQGVQFSVQLTCGPPTVSIDEAPHYLTVSTGSIPEAISSLTRNCT